MIRKCHSVALQFSLHLRRAMKSNTNDTAQGNSMPKIIMNKKKCQLGESAIRGQTESYIFFFCSLFVGKYCIVEIRETSISAFGACENVENANTSAKPNMSILPVAITACHTYIQLPPCPTHTKNCIVKEM